MPDRVVQSSRSETARLETCLPNRRDPGQPRHTRDSVHGESRRRTGAPPARGLAEKHLADLARVELRHAVRLRTLRDRVGERFVASLAADRLSARVEGAWSAAVGGEGEQNPAFSQLAAEVQAFAATPAGVGLDVPHWLRRLEREVQRVRREPKAEPPPVGSLTLEGLRDQMGRSWDRPAELQ